MNRAFIKKYSETLTAKTKNLFQNNKLDLKYYEYMKSFLSEVTAIEYYLSKAEFFNNISELKALLEKAKAACTQAKTWVDLLEGMKYISNVDHITLLQDLGRLDRLLQGLFE